MRYYIDIATVLVGLALQSLLLSRLFFRKHNLRVLQLYVSALMVTTVIEAVAYVTRNRALYRQSFWIDEIVLDGLEFVLVLSFIHRALENNPKRATVMAGLVAAAIIVAAGSAFVLYEPTHTANRWMPLVVRNVSFFAAILNMVFWVLILGRKNHDLQLLMISGGLGIKTTGEAIGYSLNTFWHTDRSIWAPDAVLIGTHLLCIYVWWRAMAVRSTRPNLPAVPSAVTSL